MLGILLPGLALRMLGWPLIRVEAESTQKALWVMALIGWIILALPMTSFSGGGMGAAFGARVIMEKTAIVDKAGAIAFTALFASLASATDDADLVVQRPHYEKSRPTWKAS